MMFYIPASFNDNNYACSWTGNYSYPTVTIRGIFDSLEKAEKATEDWAFCEDCTILERRIEEDEEDNEEYKYFDIDYSGSYVNLWADKHGRYELNEKVDEKYSAIWDEEQLLGVYDY